MFKSIAAHWNRGSMAKIFYLWAKATDDDAKRHKSEWVAGEQLDAPPG